MVRLEGKVRAQGEALSVEPEWQIWWGTAERRVEILRGIRQALQILRGAAVAQINVVGRDR